MKIQSGDTILLVSPDNKSFMVVVEEDKSFSSHMGILDLSSALGKKWGETIVSSLGNDFVLLSPTVEQKMMKVRRATQIVYPKDAALILFKTDVKAGSRVVEAATGSGALTIALANSVAPSGKVYTYERREQFMNNARDNVRRAGLSEYVEFNCGDAREGFKERGCRRRDTRPSFPVVRNSRVLRSSCPRGKDREYFPDLQPGGKNSRST